MEHKKKGLLLQTRRQLNVGSGVAGAGFLLYLAVMALEWPAAAGVIAAVSAVIAAWTCLSAAELRRKDKDAVSYNLLWGAGALTILLAACAAAGIKQFLSL